MDIKKKSYEIVSGPSKDRLFDACKYLSHGQSPIEVSFCVSIGNVTDVRIQEIQHEDGSGESFNISGVAKPPYEREIVRFNGYYNAKSRKGIVNFIY